MSKWFYDPVPIHMGSGVYFAVVTTGQMRFVAWLEDGQFVTRIGTKLEVLRNVVCWMPLPELTNKEEDGSNE